MEITILAVPYNLDQLRVGMGQAPEALIQAGLAAQLGTLGYHTELETVTIAPSAAPREQRIGKLAAALALAVAHARAAGRFPLIVGGDCLVSLGALAGLGRAAETGIAWIDAHGDFNTPDTTLSGYLGGMPLACAVGRGLATMREACGLAPIAERNVALLGVRDLDPPEAEALASTPVMLLHTRDVAAESLALAHTLGALAALPQLYLHIDIDVLDAAEAPGVDFPTQPGLSLEQLQRLAGQAATLGNLAALALTAVNPAKDPDGRTVRAGIQIISTALGHHQRGRGELCA